VTTFSNFEELDIWHKARELTRKIYDLSNKGLLGKDFALRDQIRRACISIMANVAEGFERSGTGEFLQFLAIAKGSTGEVRSLLYIALDQGYLEQGSFDQLSAQTSEISRMIGSLMNYLKKSKIKGTKYKT
jgi:four helix bundle protein